MEIQIPYGMTKIIREAEPSRVMIPKTEELKSLRPGVEIVREAMERPIGSPRLSELSRGKRTCTLIISDHTRPVPSKDIIPLMLEELREGNPDIDVTLLVATGCHRETTRAELTKKLGEDIVRREKIVVHDAVTPGNNVFIGTLPSGAPLYIDRLAAKTELLIAEGFIEPHFFAGYSGGRKAVLPGICDRKTVLGNHSGAFIESPFSRTGVLTGNPIHEDMVRAGELAKLSYIVNVIIDEEKKTVAAFAGDFKAAHEAGTVFLRKYAEVKAVYGDIVVTSNGGAPLDQNIYQCVKCMSAAEAAAKEGGRIIVLAECADGIGGDSFYKSLKECASPGALFKEFSETPPEKTIPDQWQSQILCRILMKHRVIFVTRPELKDIIRDMKMEYAPDLDTALSMAGEGEITWIPNGISLVVS